MESLAGAVYNSQKVLPGHKFPGDCLMIRSLCADIQCSAIKEKVGNDYIFDFGKGDLPEKYKGLSIGDTILVKGKIHMVFACEEEEGWYLFVSIEDHNKRVGPSGIRAKFD